MLFSITDEEKALQLSVVFKNLHLISDIACFTIDDAGISLQMMDAGQSCMLDLTLPKDWFSSWTYEAGASSDTATMIVAINTKVLQKVIDTRSIGQPIKLKTDELNDNVEIAFGRVENSYEKVFHIPKMDSEPLNMEPDQSDHMVDLVLTTKCFTMLTKQLSGFGDTVKTAFTDTNISFTASSPDIGTMVASVDMDHDVEEYSIAEGDDVSQLLMLKYIECMCAFGAFAPEVSLHFSNNRPLYLHYDLTGDASESDSGMNHDSHPRLAFYLAPMVDDNE